MLIGDRGIASEEGGAKDGVNDVVLVGFRPWYCALVILKMRTSVEG